MEEEEEEEEEMVVVAVPFLRRMFRFPFFLGDRSGDFVGALAEVDFTGCCWCCFCCLAFVFALVDKGLVGVLPRLLLR